MLVPIVALLAGLMFGVSARASGGSDLRTDQADLAGLVRERGATVAATEQTRKNLVDIIAGQQKAIADGSTVVADAQAVADNEAGPAGLTAIRGPAVRVVLNDAPLGPNGELPAGAVPDDVVIHQSDVQAIVNAMWAAGARAMTIMGQRIITISAVRCVGNTLLLQGRTYSPPFSIVAIGDQGKIEAALNDAPGVDLFLEAVDAFGLGYDVTRVPEVTAPAYDGPLGVGVATPVP